ncbi:MAG: hypothetical protein ACRC57_02140 [Sarcina sp.]
MNFNQLDCGCNDNYNPTQNYCEYIQGNSTDLHISPKDCEVRVDLRVNRKRGIRVWGQVKDCENIPVSGVLVKLLKVINYCGKQDFIGVSHTVTDCNGFYQFELNRCDDSDYKIIVSKDASGNERTIDINDNDCDPCIPPKTPRPTPCAPNYPPNYSKPNKCK